MTGSVTRDIEIQAPIGLVWAALSDQAVIAEWMEDDSARFQARVGSAFALFGGDTTGVVTEVDAPQRLSYTWRQSTWPAEWADSTVTWTLKPASDSTHLALLHSGFPNDSERDGHEDGWDDYWLDSMIDWLEHDDA